MGWAVHVVRMRGALLAALVLLGGLGFASSRASSVWASEANLWTAAVQSAPASARAWAALSRVHRIAGQRELAERTMDRALALRPGYVSAQAAQILTLLWFGDLEAARRALARMDPNASMPGETLRSARRCASAADAGAAAACAQRTVPLGLILGDTERLRAVSERLLQLPLQGSLDGPPDPATAGAAPPPARASGIDAGVDAGAAR